MLDAPHPTSTTGPSTAEPDAARGNGAEESVAPGGGSLLAEVMGMISDRVHLVSLEMQRAGQALAQMVALVMMAVAFGATAWLAFWFWLAGTMLEAGIASGWVLLTVVGINATAVAISVRLAYARARLIGLPATVRRLTSGPKPASPGESAGSGLDGQGAARHVH